MRYSVRMLAIIVLMLNSSCAALLYAPKTLQDSSGNTVGGPFDTWEELLVARRGLMYDQLLEWREELAEAEAELELELAELRAELELELATIRAEALSQVSDIEPGSELSYTDAEYAEVFGLTAISPEAANALRAKLENEIAEFAVDTLRFVQQIPKYDSVVVKLAAFDMRMAYSIAGSNSNMLAYNDEYFSSVLSYATSLQSSFSALGYVMRVGLIRMRDIIAHHRNRLETPIHYHLVESITSIREYNSISDRERFISNSDRSEAELDDLVDEILYQWPRRSYALGVFPSGWPERERVTLNAGGGQQASARCILPCRERTSIGSECPSSALQTSTL